MKRAEHGIDLFGIDSGRIKFGELQEAEDLVRQHKSRGLRSLRRSLQTLDVLSLPSQ